MAAGAPPDGRPVLDEDIVRRLLELRVSVARANEDVLAELLRLFQTDSSTRLATLRDAVARQDPQSAKRTAHALKGAAANLGALRVVAFAQQIERDGGVPTAAAIDELAASVNEALAALRDRFG